MKYEIRKQEVKPEEVVEVWLKRDKYDDKIVLVARHSTWREEDHNQILKIHPNKAIERIGAVQEILGFQTDSVRKVIIE